MNIKKNRPGILTIAIAFVVATVGIAFAHGGYGGGYDGYMMGPGMMGSGYGGYGMGPGMMGPGHGGYMMGYGHGSYMHDNDDWGNLPNEQADKLEAAQEQFYDATRDLRRSIDDKQYDLNRELNKENPNQDKAIELQNEISKLRSELDQKIVQHQIELHKILPDGYRR